MQAARSSPRQHDSGGFRWLSQETRTRHSNQTTQRSAASRLETHGVAGVHANSSAFTNPVARHTGTPNERISVNTIGRSRPRSGSHSTRRTSDDLFDELASAFSAMDFIGSQVPGSGRRTLPTFEEMEGRTRSSEHQFLGLSGFHYTDVRGLLPLRGVPVVSALQRPGFTGANHTSHSIEPSSPMSVTDNRYLWSDNRGRPSRSAGHSSGILRISLRNDEASMFEDVFGESLGSRFHRSAAANMIRSFLSSVVGPLGLPWRGPWEFRIGFPLSETHRDAHQRHSRLTIGGTNSSFLLFAAAAADPANFDVLEHNIGRFIEEVESSFAFEDFDDLDTPLMLVVSRGDAGAGEDFVPHIWGGGSGPRVTFQQLSESRTLRENLGQHTFKWTFGEAKQRSGQPSTASHGVKTPAGTSKGMAQRTHRGLGELDASTAALPDRSGADVQTETHNGYDCCICLSAFEPGDALLTLRCLHIFHERCIDRWIKTSYSVKCPLCSTKIAEPSNSDNTDE